VPPLWPLAPFVIGAYLAATGIKAVRVSRELGAAAIPTVWRIFPVLHASHAAGFWAGLVRYLRTPDWPETPEVVAPVQAERVLRAI